MECTEVINWNHVNRETFSLAARHHLYFPISFHERNRNDRFRPFQLQPAIPRIQSIRTLYVFHLNVQYLSRASVKLSRQWKLRCYIDTNQTIVPKRAYKQWISFSEVSLPPLKALFVKMREASATFGSLLTGFCLGGKRSHRMDCGFYRAYLGAW